MGGRIDYACSILSVAAEPIHNKSVQAIAMLSRARSPVLPELATAHEQGLNGFDIYSWNAVFLPKATPPEIVAKMVEGRLRKSLGEITLTGQLFVKDPDVTIEKLLKGARASVTAFERFEVGAGSEKRTDDFGAEVARLATGS